MWISIVFAIRKLDSAVKLLSEIWRQWDFNELLVTIETKVVKSGTIYSQFM